jgi:hypothetical protein
MTLRPGCVSYYTILTIGWTILGRVDEMNDDQQIYAHSNTVGMGRNEETNDADHVELDNNKFPCG